MNKISICCFPSLQAWWSGPGVFFFPFFLGRVGKGNRGGRVGFSGFVGGGEEKTGWGVGDGKVERVSISVFVTIRKEGKDEMRRK